MKQSKTYSEKKPINKVEERPLSGTKYLNNKKITKVNSSSKKSKKTFWQKLFS